MTNFSARSTAKRSLDALSNIEKEFGGRLALVQALQYSDINPDHARVVSRIADPANDKVSLYTICDEEGVTVGKFLSIFQQATVAKAVMGALVAHADRIGELIGDVVKRSLPMDVECPRCHGTPGKKPCTRCRGQGTVVKEPGIDRQKLAMEVYKIYGKGPQVAIGINQQVNTGGQTSRLLNTILEASDKILYQRAQIEPGEGAEKAPKVVEAEVIDSPYVIPTPAGTRPKDEDVPP
jgi:hypothetical protein